MTTAANGAMVPHYLENNVVRFVYLLRAEGLKIGTSEVLDALGALQLVQLEDKGQVKAALGATLVKKAADKELFEQAFERFFVLPEERESFRQLRRRKLHDHQEKMEKAAEALTFRGEQLELSEVDKTVFAYMPQSEKDRLKNFLQMNESRDTLKRGYRPFLEVLVKGRLRFWYGQLHQKIKDETARPDIGDEDLNAIRDVMAGRGEGGRGLLTEDMQKIARKDLPQATALVRKMARMLATRISRRFRCSKNRRRLDLRATIRRSIPYGGVPFALKYRNRHVKKPKLLLICDVSGSMVRYTSFVLQFIYGLNSAVQRIESFVFAEGLERITPYFQSGSAFESTMARLVRESKQWGGGTSLHRALQELTERYGEELTRNTIVIIVSDTRTIRYKEALAEVGRLREKVKEILWLNTLPGEEWGNYTTATAFRKVTAMFPCNTLADLEQVLSRKLLIQ